MADRFKPRYYARRTASFSNDMRSRLSDYVRDVYGADYAFSSDCDGNWFISGKSDFYTDDQCFGCSNGFVNYAKEIDAVMSRYGLSKRNGWKTKEPYRDMKWAKRVTKRAQEDVFATLLRDVVEGDFSTGNDFRCDSADEFDTDCVLSVVWQAHDCYFKGVKFGTENGDFADLFFDERMVNDDYSSYGDFEGVERDPDTGFWYGGSYDGEAVFSAVDAFEEFMETNKGNSGTPHHSAVYFDDLCDCGYDGIVSWYVDEGLLPSDMTVGEFIAEFAAASFGFSDEFKKYAHIASRTADFNSDVFFDSLYKDMEDIENGDYQYEENHTEWTEYNGVLMTRYDGIGSGCYYGSISFDGECYSAHILDSSYDAFNLVDSKAFDDLDAAKAWVAGWLNDAGIIIDAKIAEEEPTTSFADTPRRPDDVDSQSDIRVCPLCGSDSFDGEVCSVCGYQEPPEGFGDIAIETEEDMESIEVEIQEDEEKDNEPADPEEDGQEQETDGVEAEDESEEQDDEVAEDETPEEGADEVAEGDEEEAAPEETEEDNADEPESDSEDGEQQDEQVSEDDTEETEDEDADEQEDDEDSDDDKEKKDASCLLFW